MRLSLVLTIIAALIAAGVIVGIGSLVIRPDRSLITAAQFAPERISPNADGRDDVTEFSYALTRTAQVWLTFTAQDGAEFVFRADERRIPGKYRVLFSGVVDGYRLPQETFSGEALRRLMPDGVYQWTLRAVALDDGEIMERSGQLEITDADTPLPEITSFEVGPQDFTPNQDGVADRAMINVYLEKESDLTVFLLSPTGERVYVARRDEGREIGEAGRHVFDYEGGVDIGADPPPDGQYTVIAQAQDAVGQIIQRTTTLTLRNGGKPRAEIVGQPTGVDVVFEVVPYDPRYFADAEGGGDLVALPADADALTANQVTLPVGDLLVFRLTVYNYGPTPIRTSGPPPGTVYEQTQLAASLGYYDQAGVWRVGLQCETSGASFPWRWAIGTADDLFTEVDPANGNVYSYLPPEGRAVVWGAVRMTEYVPTLNPQACWAGLIHEGVEVSLQNANVGRRQIQLANITAGGQ